MPLPRMVAGGRALVRSGSVVVSGVAPSYVSQLGQNATTGPVLTQTMVYTVPAGGIAAGSLLVLGVGTTDTNDTMSVTDSRSNVWASAQSALTVGLEMVAFYSVLGTALQEADVITIDFGQESNGRGWALLKLSGPAASPLDKTAGETGTSTTPDSGTTAARAQSNELLIGFVAYGDEVAGTTYTDGGGFTAGTAADTGDGSGLYPEMTLVPLRKAVTAIGTEGVSGTLSGSQKWCAIVAGFKGA